MSKELAAIARKHGTPCFAYDLDAIAARAKFIQESFPADLRCSYAVKANPNLELLRRISRHVECMDISSGGELLRLQAIDWDLSRASFTGPGKSDVELTAAIECGVGHIVVESVEEASRISVLAGGRNQIQPILARISPTSMPAGFGVKMSGKATPFGIDEEEAEVAVAAILKLQNIRFDGFHIYSGTQCLKASALVENYANFARIFRALSAGFDLRPRQLIFGSGLGVPYYSDDQPLDLPMVAKGMDAALQTLREDPRFSQTSFLLELGRYLVGEAGYYLTKVTRVKASRGVKIAICDGGMNHHLAACGHMGTVIHRNYRMFRVPSDCRDAKGTTEIYDVVGPLCTSIDRLGHNAWLAPLKADDVIAIECSGAYGLSASPIHFISHSPAREILFERFESGELITRDVSELGAAN